MNYIDIIYSRASKEDETIQEIEIQEIKVCEKFNLKNALLLKENEQIIDNINFGRPLILRERGSAYMIEKVYKRLEFFKILHYAFKSDILTIDKIFLSQYEKVKIRLYVWDSHRLMRNIRFSLLFLILADLCDLEIYTFKDGRLKTDDEETPIKTFSRYLIFSTHAFSGQEYSYTTSQNVKKSVKRKEGIGIAYGTKKDQNGIKWGRPFTDANGNKVKLQPEQVKHLNVRVLQLDTQYKAYRNGYYSDIINTILEEFGVRISKSYITWLKNKEN
jgi:hypothetical protein